MWTRFELVALRSAGVLLGLLGISKAISAFSGVPYLGNPDPVLDFLSNRMVLLGAATVELAIAACLVRDPIGLYPRICLVGLCCSFTAYRVGLSILQTRAPCPCLGRASDWLHLTPKQTDHVALSLLVILFGVGIVSSMHTFVRGKASGA